MEYFKDSRDWFFQKRYGMFIHWGLYAIGGFHEQEQFRKNIHRNIYEKYRNHFEPKKYNPREWVQTAKERNMEYLVFTAKHQDGFCMWDTALTDFNVMHTPYGRDVLKELADVCHEENFPLMLYYCITDNHHPSYPNKGAWHELAAPLEGDKPDLKQYLEYVRAQVRELCTNYGTIHGFFWDANHLEYCDESFNWLIRDLQPCAVVNGRGFDSGDYNNPEREYDERELQAQRRFSSPTEANQSIGMGSWGYRKEEDFYSSKFLMQSMDRIMALGGNYLLNVAPDADGELDPRYVERLKPIGSWMERVKEAFYDAVPVSDAINNRNLYLTCKGNDVYVHFFKDPAGTSVELAPLETEPEEVVLLNDGRKLRFGRTQGTGHWTSPMEYLRIHDLPVEEMYGEVMILKMHYRHLPKAIREWRDNWKLQEPVLSRQKLDTR